MDIKKIVSSLLFVLIIMCVSITYASNSQNNLTHLTKKLEYINTSKLLISQTSTYTIDENDFNFSESLQTTSNFRVFDPTVFDPSESKPSSSEKGIELGNKLVGLIQAFGSIVSVGALIVIGIKYMLGSIEEKAEYKKTMIPYIIGAIFTFSACNIVSAIYNVLK